MFYVSCLLCGVIIVYDFGVFLRADWTLARAALIKAFNLFSLGIYQPHAVRSLANKRYSQLYDMVCITD